MRKYSSWSIPDHLDLWRSNKLLLGENPNYNEIFKEKIDIKAVPWGKKMEVIFEDN